MAKITTIIDIGSNSCTMVVLKKSSRFAFSLLNETKAKVKLAEGSYENNGYLQKIPMQRTFEVLKSFLKISHSLKSRKTLCVATSALRDAPNANQFKQKVLKELGLNIKIIDGKKEAFFGAVSAINLLHLDSFISVDIGGGSTEFALVINKNIIDNISLDLGVIRINELLKINGFDATLKYINQELDKLQHIIEQSNNYSIVTIGGTARAIARAIIKQSQNKLGFIHGLEYDSKELLNILHKIKSISDQTKLKTLGIKTDRLETIYSGSLILEQIINRLGTNRQICTNGAGIREGVYLSDLLRNSNLKFPNNFDMSVRSLLDRFSIDKDQSNNIYKTSQYLYNLLQLNHNLNNKFLKELLIASKLSTIGNFLSFYKYSFHSFNFILNGLNYGFSHKQRVLIAFIVKTSKNSLPSKNSIEEYKDYLPAIEELKWLSFIIAFSIALNSDYDGINYLQNITLEHNTIICKNLDFLIKEKIKKLQTPKEIKLKII